MYFNLVLILVSSAGILCIVVAKIVEIKTNRPGVLSRSSAAGDPIVRRKIEMIQALVSRFNKSTFESFFKIVAYAVFHIFGTAGLFLSKHYGRFTRWVRGKKFLKGGGAVSFFLKGMAESKGEKKEE